MNKDSFDPSKIDFSPGSGSLVIDGEEISVNDSVEDHGGKFPCFILVICINSLLG